MLSPICKAHSGEEIKYSTCKRGEICIYDSRLSIYGSIQPDCLAVVLAKADPQVNVVV